MELSFFLAIFLAVSAWQKQDVVSGKAPVLQGRLLDGTALSSESLRGKPVLIHFWATWCPVCAAEQGTIASLAEDHTVITVAMQSGDETAVRKYMKDEGLRFPVLNDEMGRIAAAYGVKGVPTSFVLDPRGDIQFAEVGYTTGPGLRARLWWAGR